MSVLFFTDPYYDELLYSALSRYYYESRTIPQYRAELDLYGSNYSNRPRIFLASHLKQLAESLGPMYTVDSLLNNNTVYPFFKPFTPKEQARKVVESMCQKGWHASGLLGISSRVYKHTRQLRYCPECARADIEVYGEAYLHRLCNLPGIDACVVHGCQLEDYEPDGSEYPDRSYVRFNPERLLEVSVPCNPYDLKLADCARQVLECRDDSLYLEKTLKIMKYHLKQKGYLYGSGNVNYRKLYRDLQDYYPTDFLKEKGCYVDFEHYSRRDEWITWFRPSSDVTVVPFRFLLVVIFLCGDFNTFLDVDLPDEAEEFVCLNPACENYNKSVSTEVGTIHDSGSTRKIVRCSCGMVYSVRSERETPVVIQYGRKWYDRFLELEKQNLTRKEIASIMGISVTQVKNLRKRRDTFDPECLDHRIQKAREDLLEVLETVPDLNRRQLLNYKRIYSVLKNYDSRWLDEVLPCKHSSKSNSVKKDFQKIDLHQKECLPEVVETLKEKFPDKRVTRVAVEREINVPANYFSKLPQSNELLNTLVESKEEFRIRKGKYVIDKLVEDGEKVSIPNLRRHKVYGLSNPAIFKALYCYFEETYLS